MTRSILFDTETTGLEPDLDHRIVEIAAIELINELPTGRHFYALVNPDRDIPEEATRIHGFTAVDLAGKSSFAAIAEELLDFFEDSPLIAHNAAFDFAFLNAEFTRLGLPCLDESRMIDTLGLARLRFPGLPNSLDALCRRFSVDASERTTHNALLDCRLLAEVYVELAGGRQRDLSLINEKADAPLTSYTLHGIHVPRIMVPTPAERYAHTAFVKRMREPIWLEV
jgi:DNA polymerase III subunit epsilon